jgi:ABC-2 type transport system ATP-binding protein
MITVSHLSKAYGSQSAVDDLSFVARAGTVTGFLGPNGAGKTTTLRALLGIVRPDRGEALVGGRRYADLAQPLRTVGSLLNARAVSPRRSARDHLLALAVSNGISSSRVDTVLDRCGLASAAKRPAGRFSLGMSQRLGVAAALLGEPEILVLDEPVNGLDPEGIIWIRELLRGLADEGRTVLLSSHLMGEVAQTATDLVIIGRGRLLVQTSVAALVQEVTTTGCVVRTPDPVRLRGLLSDQGWAVTPGATADALTVSGATTDEVGRVAGHHHVVLLELSPLSGSLEDAYLSLTGDAADYVADAA